MYNIYIYIYIVHEVSSLIQQVDLEKSQSRHVSHMYIQLFSHSGFGWFRPKLWLTWPTTSNNMHTVQICSCCVLVGACMQVAKSSVLFYSVFPCPSFFGHLFFFLPLFFLSSLPFLFCYCFRIFSLCRLFFYRQTMRSDHTRIYAHYVLLGV